jgi:hypothetical protein
MVSKSCDDCQGKAHTTRIFRFGGSTVGMLSSLSQIIYENRKHSAGCPPLAHYDNNVGNTCHETTHDIHFEMPDTRSQFVERQNYFHKQSILDIEIFSEQKTIQDGAIQYFCSVNGGGIL